MSVIVSYVIICYIQSLSLGFEEKEGIEHIFYLLTKNQ